MENYRNVRICLEGSLSFLLVQVYRSIGGKLQVGSVDALVSSKFYTSESTDLKGDCTKTQQR